MATVSASDSPERSRATSDKTASSGLKSLREMELEAARQDVARVFDALDNCCSKVDDAVSKLGEALAAAGALEKKSGSTWALRDLRLSRRLMLSRLVRDVGTAFQKLGSVTRTIRTVSKIVRREVDAEMPALEGRGR